MIASPVRAAVLAIAVAACGGSSSQGGPAKPAARPPGTRLALVDGKITWSAPGATMAVALKADGAFDVVATYREKKDGPEETRRRSGKLTAGVAHDFNNLLTAIIGYSDLLAGALGPEHRPHRYVGEVKRGGERAAALTRQLLAFSRKQVLQPKVLDLNAVVTNMHKMLRRFVNVNRMADRVLTDKQEWEFDEAAQRWKLTSPFPIFFN